MRIIIAAIFLCALTAPAFAQAEPTPTPPGLTAVEGGVLLPAGAVLEFELVEPLSSRTAQQGQTFAMRLASPLAFEGREIVPAGAVGGGEVIDAKASAFGGRPGRLTLSARFIEINGTPARIRGLQWSGAGRDRANGAL
ncbi:MAG: hypothetical protein ABW199_09965, partial [Caulobacterales bacterium]